MEESIKVNLHNLDFYIIYRMAEKANKNNKNKPEYIDNVNCLLNLTNCGISKEQIIIFGDNLIESKKFARFNCGTFYEVVNHGNSNSFLEVLNFALNNLNKDAIVYFVEDDYLHRPDFIEIIREGLSRADYVSLYDHPDKYYYEPAATLFYTKSTHWKYTSSTTMTFATKVDTLNFDHKIFTKYIENTVNPPDYDLWNFLTKNGRKLATPIPGFATHGETQWLSPIIEWQKYL